ncbi:hypothetical protein T484DRAFT_1657349, partial [Baffinella frigidus]
MDFEDDGMREEGQEEEKGGKGGAKTVAGRKVKGRGSADAGVESRYKGKDGQFESVENDGGKGPAKSVEGWILMVTGLHEEAGEE